MQQLAWLNTAPVDGKGKRADQTRVEQHRNSGADILLPEVSAGYLADWLFDIGPTVAGGMGEGPLNYRDLTAWQDISGVVLMPWEARILKRLSHAYLAMTHKAAAVGCPAPYAGTVDDIKAKRDSVASQIKAAFGSLKKAPAGEQVREDL